MSFSDPNNAANSEIYLMELNTRSRSRLTNDSGIDTSPSFSPDGEKIVSNSGESSSIEGFILKKIK